MIARAHRLAHSGRAIGVEAREQQAGFHLRACHWQLVINRMQSAARDFERGKSAFPRSYGRAHFAQRFHDAFHGPAGERVVANQAAAERLRRQNTGEHADGGAGIPCVEVVGGRAQTVEAATVDGHIDALLVDGDAECAQAVERRVAVGSGGVIVDGGRALRNSRNHGVAVRDRFIAWEADGPGETLGPGDPLLHGESPIVARARRRIRSRAGG